MPMWWRQRNLNGRVHDAAESCVDGARLHCPREAKRQGEWKESSTRRCCVAIASTQCDTNVPEVRWDAGMMGGEGEEGEVDTFGAAAIPRHGNVQGGFVALPGARAGQFQK